MPQPGWRVVHQSPQIQRSLPPVPPPSSAVGGRATSRTFWLGVRVLFDHPDIFSGRGRAPAALLTLEPASRGLFVVCVRCGVFQIQTFSAPDFRQGSVPKITHIFGTGPCRKPVAGNFKPKMCYFRQRKKPKNSQNRKRAKKVWNSGSSRNSLTI